MMTSSAFIRRFVLLVAVTTLIAGSGCAKKAKEDESSVPNAASADDNSGLGNSDSGNAMGLQTVHFPYDSFTLDSEGKAMLKANAGIISSHATIKIQVEGHCDQRGGIQYNIALGEKRANAVKKYLEDAGVSADRITTISFGKEKPIDPAETDEAYAKNRRANFVITSK
jgi:peptidoglycan-associated lipoprotein